MRDIYGCLTPRWNPKGKIVGDGLRQPPPGATRPGTEPREGGYPNATIIKSLNDQSSNYTRDMFTINIPPFRRHFQTLSIALCKNNSFQESISLYLTQDCVSS